MKALSIKKAEPYSSVFLLHHFDYIFQQNASLINLFYIFVVLKLCARWASSTYIYGGFSMSAKLVYL